MKHNYYSSNRTHSPIQNKYSASWRLHLTVLFSLFFILVGYAQKGKKEGGSKDVILHTCAEDIGNGLYLANFGYTNPTNKTITVGPEDSYIFLSDKIEDSEFIGIQKINGITSFEPGTHDKVLSVVFADHGHVKWTVSFDGSSDIKIRATLDSPVCETDSFIVPVIGPGNGKTQGFVSPELISLGAETAGDTPSEIIYQIDTNEKVLIQIVPFNGQTQVVINILRNVFGLAYDPNPLNSDFIVDPALIISEGLAAIDVFFPIDKILPPEPPDLPMPALIDYFDIIKSAQALYTPFTSGEVEETGDAITQGDAAQTTDIVRESFRIVAPGGGSRPVDGRGVNIVLFSNSWDANPPELGQPSNEAIDVGNGDLPGIAGNGNPNGYTTPVQVIKDYPYTFGTISDEGRAMGHIAHDIAPGANLAFRTGVLSPRDFELGIQNLGTAENTIGVDDITFPGEPMFGISNIGKAIQAFTANDNYYFTSAGNFSNKAYQARFQDSNTASIPDFVTDPDAVAHVFGTSDGSEDIYQRFSVKSGETYMIVMQWAENFASQDNMLGAATDLDFWVVDDQERLLVGNNYYNDGENEIGDDARDPIEYITFRATADGEANFMITSANGDPGPLPLRYIVFVANNLQVLEYFDGASTIMGHPMAPEAFAIGAVDFRKAASPEPQVFSSFAGTLPDGSTTEVVLTSFDGVNTNVPTIGQDDVAGIPIDGDEFKNFFGTSASVVHVAAAFALMESALPSWYSPENSLDVLQLFKDNATNVGYENQLGGGIINALKTFKQLAAQTAIQIRLAVNENQVGPEGEPLILSVDSLKVTLTGKYFPEAPDNPNDPDPLTVYFGDGEGEERDTLEIISRTDTEIVVTVPPFIGNPNVAVNTAPLAGSVNNGGDSNLLPIIEDGKIALRITADDLEIEYGQSYLDKFDYTVEGLPDNVEIGVDLPNIIFTTTAVPPYPSVRNGVIYSVFPAFDLDPNNSTDDQRTALEGFVVNFKSGSFTVTKKDLTITTDPVVSTYGEAINLELDYLYDPAGIANNVDFLANIAQAHNTTFFEENTLALINRVKALVNTEIIELLNGGSWMATENTIINRVKALVNDMRVIDLDREVFENYLINRVKALVNGETNTFNAVVNGEDLLSGNVTFNNRVKALVNDSGLGGEDDGNDYTSVFTILDLLDDSEDGGSVSKFYSINLISGLDVTNGDDDRHFSYPGAFLAPIAGNFNITYQSGRIEVNPATLIVETGDLLINQGEIPNSSEISTLISGFEYEESNETVFPEGIPFTFVNSEGHEYEVGDVGVFFIKIQVPQNYDIEYSKVGILYVTPADSGLRKIRTYLDCVEYDPNGPAGLEYTANFRYENPNSQTIYVLHGPDNNLSGASAAFASGESPIVFMSGQGTFEVRFDGNQLKWSLTTLDSAHKTSTSSNASSGSNRCDSDELENPSYVLFPNPVQSTLFVQKNISEGGDLDVFDVYGILYYHYSFNNKAQTLEVDMSTYPEGIYFVRLTTNNDLKVYTVIKD